MKSSVVTDLLTPLGPAAAAVSSRAVPLAAALTRRQAARVERWTAARVFESNGKSGGEGRVEVTGNSGVGFLGGGGGFTCRGPRFILPS